MDWDRIKARDLYVLFNSFVPQGGALRSVTIYPSQTGLEKMAEEEKLGPREFREGGAGNKESAGDRGGGDEGMGELNRARLRQYQLNRLKYFYAVLVCDSKETASKIYEDCDSTEYEKSTCRIDLRFVPDDMTFDETPKETCTGVTDLTTFEPSAFTTTAFCQANVQVTWDETNIERLKKTMKKFTEEDVENDQFDDLIASSEEESSEEGEEADEKKKNAGKETKKKKKSEKKKMKKYRKLLGLDVSKKSKKKKKKKKAQLEEGKGEEEGVQLTSDHSVNGKRKDKTSKKNGKKKAPKDLSSEDEGDDDEGGMQLTWEPSVERQKQKKKGKEKLSPWEEYQQKKKDKKKEKRRDRKREKLRQQGVEDTTSLGFDDPFFNDDPDDEGKTKTKKKERRKKKGEDEDKEEGEVDRKERAALGLLMNDDEDERHSHFSLLKIMKEENEGEEKKKKRGKKRKQSETVGTDTFEMSVGESRFAGLFTDPEMHIDPTAPEFKKTKGMTALIEEVSNRRKTVRDT